MPTDSLSPALSLPSTADVARPRIGFLGVGWIGRHRLQAVAEQGVGEIAAIIEPSAAALAAAHTLAPGVATAADLSQIPDDALDALVIATPSALHAEQALAAFGRGWSVFAQKPLARTAEETRRIVAAARQADRLLAVDLSYRHVAGVARMRELIAGGELGTIFAIDLTFHNAYGPDKPWFYDRRHSGGGCVIDLGVHLVDLALWMCGPADHASVAARLMHEGRPLRDAATNDAATAVEDYAQASWTHLSGPAARMTCSWRLAAGRECVIEASFYGTRGAVALRNVAGSFYDFTVERMTGPRRDLLASPPDAWGGRAIAAWVDRLAAGERYSAECEEVIAVAALLDRIYGR